MTEKEDENAAPVQPSVQRTLQKKDWPSFVLAGCPGDFPYMMPHLLLPIMDCPNCFWRTFRAREDGDGENHCYMFREQPVGSKCGQMKVDK